MMLNTVFQKETSTNINKYTLKILVSKTTHGQIKNQGNTETSILGREEDTLKLGLA